jgi:hypothetical protein
MQLDQGTTVMFEVLEPGVCKIINVDLVMQQHVKHAVTG